MQDEIYVYEEQDDGDYLVANRTLEDCVTTEYVVVVGVYKLDRIMKMKKEMKVVEVKEG